MLRIEGYPPTLGCEERVIPILLRATGNSISVVPLREINTNRGVSGLGGRTHDLEHTLAGVSGADLTKALLPAMSLPEEKASHSYDHGNGCEPGETHSPTIGQTG